MYSSDVCMYSRDIIRKKRWVGINFLMLSGYLNYFLLLRPLLSAKHVQCGFGTAGNWSQF